jgi:hypothetical protein
MPDSETEQLRSIVHNVRGLDENARTRLLAHLDKFEAAALTQKTSHKRLSPRWRRFLAFLAAGVLAFLFGVLAGSLVVTIAFQVDDFTRGLYVGGTVAVVMLFTFPPMYADFDKRWSK